MEVRWENKDRMQKGEKSMGCEEMKEHGEDKVIEKKK